MTDIHHQKFFTAALKPDLLSTPFEVQTNWHVITGAPCSGKTTLIDLAIGKGYKTVPEVGREYIEREIAGGRMLDEIRHSEVAFCIMIKDLTLAVERKLNPKEITFLDRALPDCLTFYRIAGMNPNEILPECFRHRYASVFVLDRFPVRMDGARIEDDATADFIDQWLPSDYGALGYSVVRVPVLPPKERLGFILEKLASQAPQS